MQSNSAQKLKPCCILLIIGVIVFVVGVISALGMYTFNMVTGPVSAGLWSASVIGSLLGVAMILAALIMFQQANNRQS